MIDVESKDGDHGATLPRRPWRRATNLHVTQLIPSDLRRPTVPDTFKKKSVALLVGYVGTGFHGNTSNPQLPRGSTVDDVLEDAAFAAGGILLSNYRSKSLRRLKWSRSSRTDKGVSSLATVVSLRMELDPAAWDADVEGRAVADALNAHLPPTVRVFGVYSVPKGFQARRVCTQRTYDYLLPARCLGLPRDGVAWPGTENAGGRTDEEVLDAFRAALRSFEGSHPFHNYTRRAYYSPSNKRAEASGSGRKGKRNKSGTKGGAGMDESGAEEEDLEVDEEAEEAKEREDSLGGAGGAGEEAEAEVAGGPPYVGTRSGGYYWLLGRDEADLIGIKHMRKVTSFEAGGVETATSDADGAQTEPFVRVTVRGDSFMLYQIRKMIATAVAVALGHVPASFVPVTLVRPARAATPLAPASTLYLKRAEFMTFRKSQDANAEPGPPRMERLEASERWGARRVSLLFVFVFGFGFGQAPRVEATSRLNAYATSSRVSRRVS